jgi:hypothetical protein
VQVFLNFFESVGKERVMVNNVCMPADYTSDRSVNKLLKELDAKKTITFLRRAAVGMERNKIAGA